MKAYLRPSVSAVALLVAQAALVPSAHAQAAPAGAPAPAAPQAQAPTAGEIVVTAERRATNLQRTSVAATVLTAADLQKKGVTGVDQLQFATPSLTLNDAGQGKNFNIRGIGQGELGSAFASGVITYRDGVATFPGYFESEPYYDLASVEVLRGPQGTFAGGNATGGAVFITEANPQLGKLGGYVTAQYGNYNDAKIEGAINLPLSDTLAIRLATSDERRDTFYHITGPWTGNPGNLRAYSGRASLLWQPDSHLKVLIKGDYDNIEQGGYPGDPAIAALRPVPNNDLFNITSNAYLNGRDEFGRIVGNISWTTDGGTVFRSITGYQKGTVQANLDADGTDLSTATIADHIGERIWSQEFNIVSPDKGPFTWVLGGYYQNDKITIPAGGGYDAYTPPGALPIGFDTVVVGTNPKTAVAVFGQLGYHVTQALQLTVGARWSRSTARYDDVASVPQFGEAIPQDASTATNKLNGKVALNWTVSPQDFLYAFIATGTKAGGLNAVNIFNIPPAPFKPENVTDYEAGWKRTWLSGHLRTQLGGYYSRYTGFQVTIVDPATPEFASITNVANPTKLYGVEFSAQGTLGHFNFDFATSLSHSSLGTFYAVDDRIGVVGVPCAGNSGPANAACVNVGGHPASYAPDFTLSAGAQYTFTLNENATLTPRLDYSHTAADWASLFDDAALGDHLQARNLMNAQLTLASGPWSIVGYATNLTNQHYVAAIDWPRRLAGPPRQYGIRFSRSF